MILAASVLLAVLVGLGRRGKLGRLGQVRLRYGWVALLAFGLQVYLIYFPEPTAQGLLSPHAAVLVISYGLLLGFLWKNRSLPGIALMAIGLLANFSVMVLNGGYMPITAEALAQVGHARKVLASGDNARVLASKDIVLPRDVTIAFWLSDIFVLPPPFPIPSVFSLGDVFIALGAFWLIQCAMLGRLDSALKQNATEPAAQHRASEAKFQRVREIC